MKKLGLILFGLLELICSSVGFVVIVIFIYAMLAPDACVNLKSPIFGDYQKEACNQQTEGE